MCNETDLVLRLGLGKLYCLLEDSIDLVQLDGLLPVIECACNVDFFGGVFPVHIVSGDNEYEAW